MEVICEISQVLNASVPHGFLEGLQVLFHLMIGLSVLKGK